MDRPERTGRRGRGLEAAAVAAFFALLYCYVFFRLDPPLLYHRQGPVFFTGVRFAREFLDRPGGPAEYASAFLGQLLYFRWTGALVLTALAAGACLAMAAVLARVRPGRRLAVPLVPALLVLVPYHDYVHPPASAIGLATALGMAAAYARAAPDRAWLRPVLFAVLGAVLYYLAASAVLVYVAVAGLYDLVAGPRRWVGLVLLALGAALPGALGVYVFGLEAAEAYTRLSPLGPASDALGSAAWVALGAWLPLAMLAAAWAARRRTRAGEAKDGASGAAQKAAPGPAPAAPKTAATAPGAAPADGLRGGLRAAVAAAAGWGPPAAAAAAVGLGLSLAPLVREESALLALDLAAARGRWDEVLSRAGSLPAPSAFALHDVTRALHHAGRLPHDLFACPGVGASLPAPPALQTFYEKTHPLKLSRLCLELGQVNEAEHLAYEALEILGDRPEILRHLARVHALKGQPQAAAVYLGALQKTLWDAPWARTFASALARRPPVGDDEELLRLRDCLYRIDHAGEYDTERNLERLLETNPRNRMAREYLATHWLLTRQVAKVATLADRAAEAGETPLPRAWEEAAALAARMAGRRPAASPPGPVRPETDARCAEFFRRLEPHRRDPSAAWAALRDEFGNTYWFYCVFGRTGASPPPPPRDPTPGRSP